MEQNRDLSALEQNIGYKFKNINLLKNALTHTSYAYEHKIASNEKLEFLGDSILEFLSSKYIYNNYPNLKEGEMTKVRATVVCEDSLYKIALFFKGENPFFFRATPFTPKGVAIRDKRCSPF